MIHAIHYQRGETRLQIRRRADNRVDLRLNDYPPSPLTWEELADLVYCWGIELKKAGYPPQLYPK